MAWMQRLEPRKSAFCRSIPVVLVNRASGRVDESRRRICFPAFAVPPAPQLGSEAARRRQRIHLRVQKIGCTAAPAPSALSAGLAMKACGAPSPRRAVETRTWLSFLGGAVVLTRTERVPSAW